MRPLVLAAIVLPLCLTPPAGNAAASERQLKLLAANCLQCHARPETGAPLMGKPDDWKARIAQGEESMLRNVAQGLRSMPPLGYCAACSEADLRALTRLVAGMPDAAGVQP